MRFQEMREPEPVNVRPKTIGISPRFGAAVEIGEAVAAVFQIDLGDIVGPARTKAIAEARLCFYLVCRRCSRLSSVEIGRFVGNRDHTTVLDGVKRAEAMIAKDRWFAAAFRELLETFSAIGGQAVQ